MTIIARGHTQVRNYERALGGEPPRGSLRKSQSDLTRYLTQRLRRTNADRKEIAAFTKQKQNLLLKNVSRRDPVLKQANTELERVYAQRAKRKLTRPRIRTFEPRVISGSNFTIHVPPYDADWTFNPSGNAASANKGNGTYDLACQSLGDGTQEVAAGVMSWFFCTAADPQQRFAALLDFSDDWWDSASGYTAHNDFRMRLWVFGHSENAWVHQSDVQPSWSDGAGWFEDHGNSDEGRMSAEIFFPARANSWYQAWVWSDAQVYADSGFWGFAASSIHFSASAPLMVFGSLF